MTSKEAAIVLEDSDGDEELEVRGEAKDGVAKRESISTLAASINPLTSLPADRAQMERERLDRQRKRRREAGLADEDGDEVAKPSEPRKKIAALPKATTNGESSKASTNVPMYWQGTIKKSYNVYSPNAPGTRFEEFLRPTTPFRSNGLTHVVMATYCEDIQWLAQMFPKGSDTPEITMITLAQGELKAGVYAPLHPDLPNWVRLVVPRRGLNEYTTMHMKFLLLFYEDRLRLMILSGNLVEYDWSQIENTAFIHDFPKLSKDAEKDTASTYGTQMRRVLSSLSVPQGHFALRMMPMYDMASTECEARLVLSIPTTSVVGWPAIQELGIGRLAHVAREIMSRGDESGKSKTKVSIEAQGSSMGSYSPRWLQMLHIACMGKDVRRTLPLPIGAKANKAWAAATGGDEKAAWPPVKLLFPTDKWVKTQSIEGVNGALTFFGKKKTSIEKGFITLLHQPVSVRANVMMHHKAILALDESAATEDGDDDSKIVGWVYAGSHNLTQAAWGNISTSKQSGAEPQLTMNNWELGVMMPVRARDVAEMNKENPSASSMAAQAVTWRRPARAYGKDDVPWDQFDQ